MKLNTSFISGAFNSATRVVMNPVLHKYLGDTHASKFAVAYAAISAVELAKDVYSMVRNNFTYTITVPQSNNRRLIEALFAEVNDQASARDNDQHIGVTMFDRWALTVVPAPGADLYFRHGGHRYTVRWESRGIKAAGVSNLDKMFGDDSTDPGMFTEDNRIVITCYSQTAQEHMMDYIRELVDNERTSPNRQSSVYVRGRYDDFVEHSRLRARDLDTVILKEGQLERICEYIDDFIDLEDQYADIGIPYKTGILLYGPPGTGKTSLINALAHHYQKNAYIISLSTVKSGEELLNLFTDIPRDSFLLLEDIDLAANISDDSRYINAKDGLTSADLLNVLDGVASPHGLITIMTTNHKDKIMPALLRPGRVDLQEEISYLDNNQLQRLLARFVGEGFESLPTVKSTQEISPAKIIGIIRDNLKTPEKVYLEVRKLLS